MSERTIIHGARVLDPASGQDGPATVVVEDGRIAAMLPATEIPADGDRIDAGGLCLAPGLVDLRARIGEPGEEHKETIETASIAAAAGGVTALAMLPNTDPPVDSVHGLEFVARRARSARRVKIFPYACVTVGAGGNQLTEMGLLAEAGAIAFTDGHRAIGDSRTMMRALSYATTFGLTVSVHPEDPSLAGAGVLNSGETATRLGLPGIPRVAELIQIERDLRLAEATGARLHIAHVSTLAGLDAIRAAKQRGLRVTCDVSPPYFALTEVDVGVYRTFAKLSPPLRDELDRRAVVDAMADGTVDAIASDHDPQDTDAKRQPFEVAAFGGAGLETLLPVALDLYHQERLSLLQIVDLLTRRPADILGLPLGRLAVGGAADLILFDPDVPWRIDVEKLVGKSRNSPFDGRLTSGRVMRTFVDGRTVFQVAEARP